MISAVKALPQNAKSKACMSCNGLMLAATPANAEWLIGKGRYRDCLVSALNGMLKKRYCCTECASPTLHESHGRKCTLVSENPPDEVPSTV